MKLSLRWNLKSWNFLNLPSKSEEYVTVKDEKGTKIIRPVTMLSKYLGVIK